jgi:hypothetical protein
MYGEHSFKENDKLRVVGGRNIVKIEKGDCLIGDVLYVSGSGGYYLKCLFPYGHLSGYYKAKHLKKTH